MPDCTEVLTPQALEQIHTTSMRLLSQVGVEILDEEATGLLRSCGAKVDGQKVLLTEDQVVGALGQAPTHFTMRARDPEKSIDVGNGDVVFAPGYGPPFLADPLQGSRTPTQEDYGKLVRLCHMLPNQNLTGYLMVQPGDLPPESAHLHMLKSTMVLSDKPFIGCSEGREGAVHCMEMASILFDEPSSALTQTPFTIGLINTLSPLRFSGEMASALVEYARCRQPVLIAAAAMAGSTAPITLAGLLAQQNAEVLAGIVLAQWISPGTPVIYGSTSTNMDMRTGTMAVGSPELSLIAMATGQLARYYGLPCRAGGAITDSHTPDIQAGYESAFGLLAACMSGVDFVLHAAGVLSSYLAFSYEKFVLDDELCGMVRRSIREIEVSAESLCYDSIARIGPGGDFLNEPLTLDRCRTEFWLPSAFDRQGLPDWLKTRDHDVLQQARERCASLLDAYQVPPIDSRTLGQLDEYIAVHAA